MPLFRISVGAWKSPTSLAPGTNLSVDTRKNSSRRILSTRWNWTGHKLSALKQICFRLLIPQLNIIRVQSPFWKSGSVRNKSPFAAGSMGHLICSAFMEMGGFHNEHCWWCIFAGFDLYKSGLSEACVLTMSIWSRQGKFLDQSHFTATLQ